MNFFDYFCICKDNKKRRYDNKKNLFFDCISRVSDGN